MKTKKLYSIIALFVIAIMWLSTVAAAPATYDGYKTVMPDTNLYEENFLESKIISVIPHNAPITKIGEPFMVGELSWQKISYNTINGYVLAKDIYLSMDAVEFTILHARAKSTKIGKAVDLYLSNTTESGIVLSINDGEKLDIVKDNVDYDGFYKIDYKGSKYFVRQNNVTLSLSTNQTLAIILIAATVAVSGGGLAFYFIYRKKKEKKQI